MDLPNSPASVPPSGASQSHFAPEGTRDPIPLGLIVAIFFFVAFVLWYLMWPTWQVDWHTFQKANALQKHDYKSAIPHLEWLMNSNTPGENAQSDTMKNPTFLSEMGLCQRMIGNYAEGEKYYRLAQQYRSNLPPDDTGNPREGPEFNTEIAFCLYKQGKVTEAEPLLQQALKANKIDPYANFICGELEFQRGNYVKAANYFKVVAKDKDLEPKVRDYYAQIEKKLFAGS